MKKHLLLFLLALFTAISPALAAEVTDVLTSASLGLTGNQSYNTITNKGFDSGAQYSGSIARDANSNTANLQCKKSVDFLWVTKSAGRIKSVTITLKSGTSAYPAIYGYNEAKTASSGTATYTFASGKLTWTPTEDYTYFVMKAGSNATYLESISITWETAGEGGGGSTETPDPVDPDPTEPDTPTASDISFSINGTTLGKTDTKYVETAFDFTVDGVTFNTNNINPSNGQVRGNQADTGDANFYLYNKTAIPNIEKIILTYSSDNSTIVPDKIFLTVGNTVQSSKTSTGTKGTLNGKVLTLIPTTDNNSYFRIQYIKGATSNTCTLSKVEIFTKKETPGKTTPELKWSSDAVSGTWVNGSANISLPTLSGADGLKVNYTSSNDKVASVDSDGNVTVLMPGTADITATSEETAEYNAAKATYTLTVALGDEPITVAEALAFMKAGYTGQGVVEGIISEMTELSLEFKNATYKIVDSLTDSESLVVYRGKYIDGADFTQEGQIEVGGKVKVQGELVNFNGTLEFTTGSKILEYTAPEKEEPAEPVAYEAAFNGGEYEMTVGSTMQLEVGTSHPTFKYDFLNDPEETDIVTINAEGKITALAEGYTIVTVSWETDETWAAGSAEFDVTVTAAQGGETPEPKEIVDEITLEFTGVDATAYDKGNFSNKEGKSGAVYAGQLIKKSSSTMQMRATEPCGIVTTATGGRAAKVSITWAEGNTDKRTLDVYGSNNAYETAKALYDNSTSGTKIGSFTYSTDGSTATEITIDDNYAFIGLRSGTGAIYVDGITITWLKDSGETPEPEPEQVATPVVKLGDTVLEEEAEIEVGSTITISSDTEGALFTGYIEFENSTLDDDYFYDEVELPINITITDEMLGMMMISGTASKEGMIDSESLNEFTLTVVPAPVVETPEGPHYMITFGTVKGDQDASQVVTTTTAKEFIVEGAEYVETVADGIKNTYQGLKGLKIGKSGEAGSITFNLSDKGKRLANYIVVNAAYWKDKNAKLLVNDNEIALEKADLDDYIIKLDGSRLESITLASTNASDYRLYVQGLTIYYTKEPEVPSNLVLSVSDDEMVTTGTEVTATADDATSFTVTTYTIDGIAHEETIKGTEASFTVDRMHRRFEVVANNEVGSTDAVEAFYTIGSLQDVEVPGAAEGYALINDPKEIQVGDKILIAVKGTDHLIFMSTIHEDKESNGFVSVESQISSKNAADYQSFTEVPETAMILEVDADEYNNFKLKNENGYLYVGDKEISFRSSIQQGSNLTFSAATEGDDHYILIGGATYIIKYNNGYNYFRGYKTTTTSVLNTLLYKYSEGSKTETVMVPDAPYALAIHYNETALVNDASIRAMSLTDDTHDMTNNGDGTYTVNVKNLQGGFALSIDGEHELAGHIDNATTPKTGEPYVYVRNFNNNNPLSLVLASNADKAAALTTNDSANGLIEHHGNTDMTVTFVPFHTITLAVQPVDNPTGVDDIAIDAANGNVEFFNLQGVRLDGRSLVPGTVVIRRQGNEVSKYVVR